MDIYTEIGRELTKVKEDSTLPLDARLSTLMHIADELIDIVDERAVATAKDI